MKLRDAARLIIAVLVCELVGSIGSIFTIPNIPVWYASLTKPFFAPPNWLFGPAWIILFALMGIALFLVWQKGFKSKKAKVAGMFFVIQFAFNILWSFLFFGLRNPFAGFVGIIFLWIFILATIISFNKVSKKAALLLVPYLLWVTFAGMLNCAVWLLNL